jgi:hypothetical protein
MHVIFLYIISIIHLAFIFFVIGTPFLTNVNAYLLILLALMLMIPREYQKTAFIIVYGYLILELATDKQNYEYIVFWLLCLYIISTVRSNI